MSAADEDAEDIRREQQHWLAKLQAIPGKRAQLDVDERETVRQARLAGVGWDEIAAAIGVTDPAARYGEPDPDQDPF